MTTQHTEFEHNEEHDPKGVLESVAAQQHTPDTAMTDETTSSPDSPSSQTDAAQSNDAFSAGNEDTSSTEQTTPEEFPSLATATFAEETGNTIPEISSFVSAEDVQAPTTQEEASTTSAEDTQNTQVASQQEVPFSSTIEDQQAPVAQQENLSTVDMDAKETDANVQPQEASFSDESTESAEESIAPIAQMEQEGVETLDAASSPVFVVESETIVAEIAPQAEGGEETVRPFTAFIEEYHQAQAEAEAQAEAHLSASIQDAQVEAFSEFAAPETEITAVDQPISLEEALPPVDFGEGSAFVPNDGSTTTVDVADVNSQSLAEAAVNEENQRATASETSQSEETSPTTQAPERPVSPLLRPAMRPRSRHGARHRDESTTTAHSTAESRATTEPTTSTQAAGEATTAAEQPGETTKPPRRYRFDRPSSQNAQTAASVSKPVASNGGGTLTPPPATQPVPTFARTEEVQAPTSKTPTVSAPATNGAGTTAQPNAEATITESTATLAAPVEQGRHRQGHGTERQDRPARQEREKEQSAPTPVVAPQSVAEIATALVNETNGDVGPEDMPPLEYADLQKANSSRRRRRHRTATPATSATPTAKESESVGSISTNGTQQSAPLAPVAPITSTPHSSASDKSTGSAAPTIAPATASASASATPYTITSGYTVGQMNQGNEQSGPFMGPEPSPARGSVNTTRDGRTVRVESQPQRSAPYQTRAVEGMLPVAAMNHFANIVSQAIQTQSDRMVAELRRANQSPTNVSVSLPPFPSTERVGVFVDVANLLYSARTQRIAIDFGKLLDFLRGNRRLIRAHAYCPTSPQPGDEQMFLTAVKGLGYRITTKNYKTFASGAKKADLDLDLCMDVVRIVDGKAVDAIVLVSGDSDFMPMLDYCSDHGVRVEVAAFDEAMSATLRQSCDLFINLSMLEEIRA